MAEDVLKAHPPVPRENGYQFVYRGKLVFQIFKDHVRDLQHGREESECLFPPRNNQLNNRTHTDESGLEQHDPEGSGQDHQSCGFPIQEVGDGNLHWEHIAQAFYNFC